MVSPSFKMILFRNLVPSGHNPVKTTLPNERSRVESPRQERKLGLVANHGVDFPTFNAFACLLLGSARKPQLGAHMCKLAPASFCL